MTLKNHFFLYHQLSGVGEKIVKNESALSVYHQDSEFNYDVHQLQSETVINIYSTAFHTGKCCSASHLITYFGIIMTRSHQT